MEPKLRVLLVEDDKPLANEISYFLRAEKFVVDQVMTGDDAEFLASTEHYDAALLDLGLPTIDGVEVLRRWRQADVSVPVLIITARNTWSDKAASFEAGADDYVTKPFLIDEVVVRLRALIRRANGHAGNRVACGSLTLDVQSGMFAVNGLALTLTAFEWRILTALMLRKGTVVPRCKLAECAYDYGSDVDFKSMEVIIGRIRRKIGGQTITTIRNRGYMLDDPTS